MFSKLVTQLKDLVNSDDGAVYNPPPKGEFALGINFGGDAVEIAGHAWDSYSTALANGLSVPAAAALETFLQPTPYANPKIRQMLNSVVYRTETLEISQPLTNGVYDVYLWIMENFQTDWHSLEVRLGDQIAANGIGKLPLGHWACYGPYTTTIAHGSLQLTISTNNPNIDAHIMGMSIFKLS